jgi:hypothetical protein
MVFCLTSKMSHGLLGRDSCRIRPMTRTLHSEIGTTARGVTEQAVGSGALLGRLSIKRCQLLLWLLVLGGTRMAFEAEPDTADEE